MNSEENKTRGGRKKQKGITKKHLKTFEASKSRVNNRITIKLPSNKAKGSIEPITMIEEDSKGEENDNLKITMEDSKDENKIEKDELTTKSVSNELNINPVNNELNTNPINNELNTNPINNELNTNPVNNEQPVKITGNKKIKISIKSNKEFENRANFIDLLEKEEKYKIQVFSLEPVEIFEDFLGENKIEYVKAFSSKIPSAKSSKIHLILQDSEEVQPTNRRTILYSNKRNEEFIPYKFKLTEEEKGLSFINNNINGEERNSASANITVNIPEYISNTLNYTQSVLMMALIKGGDFKRIIKEIKEIDPELDNSFVIKNELNWLFKNKLCVKKGGHYRINISQESVMKICEKLGFNKNTGVY